MKTIMAVMALGCVLAAGCDWSPHPPVASPDSPEARQVQSINDSAIREGIVRQSTVFPYHFEADSWRLNGLGVGTVSVLAEHFRGQGGALNIRRGSAPPELYAQRVQTVLAAMEKAGVPRARLRVTDLPSAGDGMSADRVLTVLKPVPAFTGTDASFTGSSAGSTGGTK